MKRLLNGLQPATLVEFAFWDLKYWEDDILKVTSDQKKLLHFVHGGLCLTRGTKAQHQ